METSTITEHPGLSPKPPSFDYNSYGTDSNGNIYHELYGKWWPSAGNYKLIDIELACFREGRTEAQGGLGKYGHLRECVDLLWNKGKKEAVQWNPWLEKLLEEGCENLYLAVAGCSSSSKSFGGAVFGIVSWLSDPLNTLVAITSTSIAGGRKRIWKSVISLWNALPEEKKKLGKIKPSLNMIHYIPPDGSIAPETSAICLIAAEPKQEASAQAKFVGLKNELVILCADELCELSPAVLAAADNLDSNPEFRMWALSNPKSPDDPFGLMMEPEDGWTSVDEGCFEWKTKLGKCIRFDCLQSPNYLEREIIYPYMLTYEKIESARRRLGENSARFFRFFRGFVPLQGVEDVLYSETDFRAYLKDEITWGKTAPVKVAGCDPSFSSGGDQTVVVTGLYGMDADGIHCLQLEKLFVVKENAADKENPRTEQICIEIKKILDTEGVPYKNFAIDNTGGGRSFCDRLSQLTSKEIMRIEFGGKASERRVTANDPTPASKKFVDRVGELWGVGVEFLRGGQLAGFRKDPEIITEMKSRHYLTVKGGDGERVKVESKKDMKKRSGRSPDKADAVMVLIEACRQRFHFASAERGEIIVSEDKFIQSCKEMDIVALSSGGVPEWYPMAV